MKIIVKIIGGLGNQLFAYAAGRRLALVNNAELILDHVTGFANDRYSRHYQLDNFTIPCRKALASERLEPMPRLRRRVLVAVNRYLSFESRNYIKQEGIDFDARLLRFQPRSNVYLEGYWQSEKYFIDIESQIRLDLNIRVPVDPINLLLSRKIAETTSVAVHLRFFDEPGVGRDNFSNNVSPNYYQRALETMESTVAGAHYFLFSDRPHMARGLIPFPDDRVTTIYHNLGDEMAFADLWLMSQCNHFIIANSTFSWWGAWLAKSPGKIVIAPGFEKRSGKSSWGFLGLLPETWRTL